jgi:DnaK suppressor protein
VRVDRAAAHRAAWFSAAARTPGKHGTMANVMTIDIATFKKRLADRKAELTQMLGDSAEARKPVELDQSRFGRLSRLDALQSQAMAAETARLRQDELKRINAALERIEEGEYGYCVSCGEEIGEKRLELDPSTASCIDCASRR